MKKLQFICTACNKFYPKWMGYCTSCRAWDSVIEYEEKSLQSEAAHVCAQVYHLSALKNVESTEEIRYLAGIGEWDRVLGGGLVKGSFVLLAGDPGIGKSTLLLQVAHALSQERKVLYISSEESVHQVHSRIKRIKCQSAEREFFVTYCCNINEIVSLVDKHKPDVVVIDSMQNCQVEGEFLTMHGGAIRHASHLFLAVAKERQISLIVTGHITKEGAVAGPKTLEHVVDVVLHVHAEDGGHLRILRSSKNRFGSTEEVGFFVMQAEGMVEQKDDCDSFVEHSEPTIGSALTCITEGSRTFIVEVQALTIPVKYGTPQRVITGIDHKQLILICAVLERYIRIPLHAHDIFCKVTGGMKVKSSAVHAALAFALLSSFWEKTTQLPVVVAGELGLTGGIALSGSNVFPYSLLKKYGIEEILSPSDEMVSAETFKQGIRMHPINTVQELARVLRNKD